MTVMEATQSTTHPEGYWNCPTPGGCPDCRALAREIDDAEQLEAWREEVAHEAHGRCGNCHWPAHRYPYGWDHAGCGMHACPNLQPVATCCDEHKAGR